MSVLRLQLVALPPSGHKSTSAGLQKHVGVLELQLIKCYRLHIFDHNQQLVTFIALTAFGKPVQSLDLKIFKTFMPKLNQIATIGHLTSSFPAGLKHIKSRQLK